MLVKDQLTVAILQDTIIPRDCASNLAHYSAVLSSQLPSTVDVVLLPEFFATGFIVDSVDHAQSMEGSIVCWMREAAARFGVLLCGTVAIRDGNEVYNRLLAVSPRGVEAFYDKRHLFIYGGEAQCFSSGSCRVIVDYLGWRILPLVCYDVRFPVWSYNAPGDKGYDLLIYLANFPTARIDAWDILLKARAVENQCYVAACNRIGEDHQGLAYSGHSAVINPFGKLITPPGPEVAGLLIAECHRPMMHRFRQKYPFLQDGVSDLPLSSRESIAG